ncbi:hypothetical protein F5Y16DRAFT_81236 [Xylariaceae sp. FL0255]|nr:hypothetical protein F5Y16DRAFT_81236 [Xylariaceae sp. FL0255]
MEAKAQIIETTVVVPASTLTPVPSTNNSAHAPPPPPLPVPGEVQIELLPPSAASDTVLIGKIVDIVCTVYSDSENGIYGPGFVRTTPDEVARLICHGELVVAYLVPDSTSSTSPAANGNISASTTATQSNGNGNGEASHHNNEDKSLKSQEKIAIGCVYVKQADNSTGEYGMLAIDFPYRSGGLGRKLIQFVEKRCRDDLGLTKMRLELLYPIHIEHEGKVRLQKWYSRMGYELAALRDFAKYYPRIQPLLLGPTEFRVFEKSLV